MAARTVRGRSASRPAAKDEGEHDDAAATPLTWCRRLLARWRRSSTATADAHPAEEAGSEVGRAVGTNSWLSVSGSTAPLGAKVRTAARPSAMPTAAIARPPVTMPLHSETSTIGMDGSDAGGHVPDHTDTLGRRVERRRGAMPPTRTTSDHGARAPARADEEVRQRLHTHGKGEAVEATEVAKEHSDALEDAADGAPSPRQGGISPTTISTTSPATKPVTMGSLRNCATQPRRTRPTATTPHRGDGRHRCEVDGRARCRRRTGRARSSQTAPRRSRPGRRTAAPRCRTGRGPAGRGRRVEADLAGRPRRRRTRGTRDGQGGDEQAGEEVGGKMTAGVVARQAQPDGEPRRCGCARRRSLPRPAHQGG